jgi:1-acyl-sn-glycerol-3-phosphate acyltransferase
VPISFWILAAIALWALWVVTAHWLRANPRGDPETGLAWRLLRLYARIVHRLRVEGLENLPRGPKAGPLIVVANHTAGVDPLLIQAACPFFIRWMMALDMRLPTLEWFWKWVEIISVDRAGREVAATREAIRYLQEGGVVGIFPEGNLERPPRHILPFLPGVGLIVHRSKAPVLPVVVSGTPQVDPAWSSLWRPSRATVRFLPKVDYQSSGLQSAAIAEDLRRRFIEATGWPRCDLLDGMGPGGKGK